MIAGRCLCGAVAWRLDGALDLINYCHCSMCRRVHAQSHRARAERLFDGVGDDLHGLALVRTIARQQVVHLRFVRPVA